MVQHKDRDAERLLPPTITITTSLSNAITAHSTQYGQAEAIRHNVNVNSVGLFCPSFLPMSTVQDSIHFAHPGISRTSSSGPIPSIANYKGEYTKFPEAVSQPIECCCLLAQAVS